MIQGIENICVLRTATKHPLRQTSTYMHTVKMSIDTPKKKKCDDSIEYPDRLAVRLCRSLPRLLSRTILIIVFPSLAIVALMADNFGVISSSSIHLTSNSVIDQSSSSSPIHRITTSSYHPFQRYQQPQKQQEQQNHLHNNDHHDINHNLNSHSWKQQSSEEKKLQEFLNNIYSQMQKYQSSNSGSASLTSVSESEPVNINLGNQINE